MKHHEREYFVSRLRTGAYYIEFGDINLKILTPTIDEDCYINHVYAKAYNEALMQDLMTEDEMLEWLISKRLWTEEDDGQVEQLEKNLETLRIQIYESRFQTEKREKIRQYLRVTEQALKKLSNKKNAYYQNTCEGTAFMKKSYAFLKKCTFLEDKVYNFDEVSMQDVWYLFNKEILSESDVRDLARNDPWKGLWVLKNECDIQLFKNKERALSVDQKNIVMWSKMYDNIQESMECPTDDVIQDDDLLDGWFLIQRNKREKEKAQSEVDSIVSNDKIANSQEVFVFAQTPEDAKRIEQANTFHSSMVKKERMSVIQQKGDAVDMDFRDQKLRVRSMANEQYKAKFRR